MAEINKLITDPDNVPVRLVNGLQSGIVGGLVYFTLNTLRVGYDSEGNIHEDRAICARLRFDLEIAKMLRDQLNAQIAALTPPSDVKPN